MTTRGGTITAALFALFFASGFCSLLYQVVWLRLSFAQYGVITPVVSVVLSVFMLGLGLGSWAGGKWGPALARRWGLSTAHLYCGAELLIAVGAFAVPASLRAGGDYLLSYGPSESAAFLALSAVFIVLSILPWSTMMGATFPLMMAFVRERGLRAQDSFSFLYLANVVGAMTGTIAAAVVMVEALGFTWTYIVAAAVNVAIAGGGLVLAARTSVVSAAQAPPPAAPGARAAVSTGFTDIVLFTTGFAALALEVVWTRAFTFVLQTTIYAFAMILATYLLATWIGSALYRWLSGSGRGLSDHALLAAVAVSALLPPLINDPAIHSRGAYALLSIAPLCAVLGYLTPKLIDDAAGGDPARAGRRYGVNILGGILGPLVVGYLMLPFMDVRVAQLLLTLPLLALALAALWRAGAPMALRGGVLAVAALLLAVGALRSRSFEEAARTDMRREVRRDHSASVVAFGEGFDRGLLVNGVGIARLTPITKVMAHLTLATHGAPREAVAICFGMGTTLRSMQRWGIAATGIDLSRAVVDSFGYFHADAAAVAAAPGISIIADDGRRFLLRAHRQFDVIAIDPPPPPEGAGTSLLYSSQFYAVVKQRLAPGGLMHQWLPTGNIPILRAAARTLYESFPHVVFYKSIEDWGYHVLASETPIRTLTPELFLSRLDEAARRDLMEWYPDRRLEDVVGAILSRRTPYSDVVPDPSVVPLIHDDQPYNEYYFLRHRGLMR